MCFDSSIKEISWHNNSTNSTAFERLININKTTTS